MRPRSRWQTLRAATSTGTWRKGFATQAATLTNCAGRLFLCIERAKAPPNPSDADAEN